MDTAKREEGGSGGGSDGRRHPPPTAHPHFSLILLCSCWLESNPGREQEKHTERDLESGTVLRLHSQKITVQADQALHHFLLLCAKMRPPPFDHARSRKITQVG